MQVDVERIQDDYTKLFSVFDEWAMTEDEGKLLLGLKEKVDILRFSVTRKFDITSYVYLDSMRMNRLFFNCQLYFIPFTAPQTCYKYKTRGAVKSGSYDIDPDGQAGGEPFTVDCDFETGKSSFVCVVKTTV